MARNKKVEILSHDGQVLHPITDGDCVIFPDGETLTHKLSEDEAVMYTPEVVNSSPMFKVGEGDSSDYSANVLDGAYQEAVLKGQTYVNTIQEPSADVITLPTPFTEYERTQSKTFTEMQDGTFGLNLVGQSYVNCIQEPSEPSYVALGENLEFQNKKVEYTTDGQIKSAMLNGQTLVNLNNGERSKTLDSTTGTGVARTYACNIPYKIPSATYLTFKLKTNTTNGITGNLKVHFKQNLSNSSDGDQYCTLRNYTTHPTGDYYVNICYQTTIDIEGLSIYIDNNKGVIDISDVIILIGDHTQEDIPYFEGMQSVTMTTELENVCSRHNSSLAKSGTTFTVGTSSNSRSLQLSDSSNISKYNFKPNTKYLVQFKVTNLNLDGLDYIILVFSSSSVASGNSLFGDKTDLPITKNGIYRTVLTTSNVISTSDFVIKGTKIQWEDSTSTTRKLTISQMMCIEYQNGVEKWDLPYFETTQLMKPLKVQSVNKNLCYGTWTTGSNNVSTMDNYFRVREGEYYRVSHQGTRKGTSCHFYDKNKVLISTLNGEVLQAPSGAYYGRWALNIDKQYLNTVQIEQSNISGNATSFIEHYHKTTSALEPITLRAIGNVKDTLDLSTGEYVQRIGEITVDGINAKAKKWVINNEWSETSRRFDLDITGVKRVAGWNGATTIIKSDKINVFDDVGKANPQCNSLYKWDDVIVLYINNSTITTVDEANDWLKQNPIKIQYQLENPITRKISLEYPNLQTYADITHVQSIAMDGTLIPNIYLPSDISYKTMLKPNTSYNVIVDREVIDSTNQLTVNLGGTTANITANRTVVRTPSTLSNETLTFSGKDNRLAKAMLIESGTLINGDLPHFDGIGDVKLGRIVENLCLSNEYPKGNGGTTDTYSNNSITSKFTVSGSRVYLFDLIKPIQNGKKYFVYAPCSLMCSIGFKTVKDESSLYSVAKTNITNYAILSVDNEILTGCQLFIGQLGAMAVGSTMTIRRPILCEYIKGMENWDWESIGYFTGTKNIGNEFMRIGNKNLFDKNEFAKRIVSLSGNNRLNGDILSYDSYTTYRKRLIDGIFKPNTRYTINFNVTVNEANKNFILIWRYTDGSESLTSIGGNNQAGTFNLILTSQPNKTVDYFYTSYGYGTIVSVDLSKIQLEEASSATSYVAHKHNALYLPKDESIPLTWEQGSISYSTGGSWTDATNNTNTTRIRTQLLDLEPNETYRVSYGGNGYKYAIGFYNNSNIGSSVLTTTTMKEYYFTTTKDVHKIGIVVTTSNDGNITPSALHQVRLEKVTDVTLRSVGNVHDELDLTRGVYIQRINELVLDGSEDWRIYNDTINPDNYTNSYRTFFVISRKSVGILANCQLYSDKYKTYTQSPNDITEKGFVYAGSSNLNVVELANMTVDEFKEKISLNPITIQYPLETPIEHKINIPVKNESNQTIAKPNGIFTLPLMYSETNHIDINSQIYPKVQSRDYISYPVIANNSQLHTVSHNKLGTGNLTVNLCGTSVTSVDGTSKCTITTPSTISQYELRLSGARNKVSNVCVFSGDYMNVDVPYVQGMMNAVNPIVKNIGKNLIDNSILLNAHPSHNYLWTKDHNYQPSIKLNPNKPYKLSLSSFKGDGRIILWSNNKKTREIEINNLNMAFTTSSNENGFSFYAFVVNDGNTDNVNIQLEESPTPSQYEPYKENILKTSWSIGYNAMIKGKSISSANGTSINNAPNRYRTDFIKIDFAKIYINSNNPYCLFLYDINKKYLGRFTDSWVTDREFEFNESNAYYFIVVFKTDDGEDTTTYISSKETRITLRSLPNGVRDELNLQTGEYIQRIGEVVLDGSSDENITRGIDDTGHVNTIEFYINNIIDSGGSRNPICDSYIYGFTNADFKHFYTSFKRVVVFIEKTELLSQDVNGFKEWLSKNPITVQYQLVTPIIKQIDINNFPHSYKDGHVIIESNDPSTNVTAQMTYRCVTNRSGQIQEHTEQVEKQERQINELETLILENIRQQQNRSQNFLTSLISTLEIEEE